MRRILLACCALALLVQSTFAGELPDFSQIKIKGLVHTAAGVTRRGTPIDAFVTPGEPYYQDRKQRVLLIGGTDGKRESVDAVVDALKWFYTHEDAGALRELVILSAISCANPDGVLLDKGDENGEGGQPFVGKLPEAKLYLSQDRVETQYLRQFVTSHAADRVVIMVANGAPFSTPLGDTDVIPLPDPGHEILQKELMLVVRAKHLHRPDQWTDADFIKVVGAKYCKTPRQYSYIDTVPLVAAKRVNDARLQLKSPDFDAPENSPKSGGEIAGLLFLLSHQRSDVSTPVSKALKRGADLAFDKDGKPLAEPPFHNQMSDAVFMNGPLLSGYGKITKHTKYFDCCAQHQAFIRKLCKREDGLYRHSPLSEAAWGRGNGFVALGNALMLEDWPQDHPEYKTLLAEYRQHMAALKPQQDYTGTWHQVIDHPESYREFSCTCMIGFAMACGIRHGWLDKQEYQPCVDLAWQAVKARTSKEGHFVDVCTGTGKQKTLRDYFDREAVNGPDARGGAMALMFASEMVRE